MKLYLKCILLFLFFVFNKTIHAYTDAPVLISLNINHQDDSFGFNIVYEVQTAIYDLIKSKKIKIYDSPKKANELNFEIIQNIEYSSGTKFNQTNNVFFHEIWTSKFGFTGFTEFTVLGISIINENPRTKERINYGYVDFIDCVNFFNVSPVKCNINGPHFISLTNAIFSRNYVFNVVQFRNNTFSKHIEKSIKIKNKAFYNKNRKVNKYIIPTTKEITYFVKPSKDDQLEIGNILFANLSSFLNENREVFFNIGGGKYFDINYQNELAVTGMEIVEVWEKTATGVNSYVTGIKLFVNYKEMELQSLETLMNWKQTFLFQSIEDVLREKKFTYSLYKVNNTYLATDFERAKYLKGLTTPIIRWSNLSRYVK